MNTMNTIHHIQTMTMIHKVPFLQLASKHYSIVERYFIGDHFFLQMRPHWMELIILCLRARR